MLHKIYRGIQRRLKLIRTNRQYQGVLKMNLAIKNSHEGEQCFIIGNGPSTNTQDLTRLRDEQTFVVNEFWDHPKYKEIGPKNYIISDADMFNQDALSDRSASWGSFYRERMEEKISVLESCDTKFFFHVYCKNFLEEKNLLRNRDIFYLSFMGHFKENLKFNVDIDSTLPYPKNVIVSAIEVAAYMGFTKIYLLGCDHDFLAHQNHYAGFKHFFETKWSKESSPAEKEKYGLDDIPYEQHIYNAGVLFRNYRLLGKKLASTHPSLKIYNATPNSFLDVFPRVKFEDIKLG